MLERLVSLALSLALLGGPEVSRDLPAPDSASPRQMDVTFRKTVQEVHLDFLMASQNGRPVPELKAGEFTIFQDNHPVSAITSFHADQNLPLHLLLLIDASDSMTRGFAAERNAAIAFLRSVVRPGIDRSAVASFSTHLTLDPSQDASSPDTLLRIGMLRSQGVTALYDSLYESAAAFRNSEPERFPNRRVLVLLSDGDDNYSLHSLDSAIAAAQKADMIIYAISAHDPRLVYRGDPVLERITSETGGRLFIVKKFEHSVQAFAQIEQEIRSQYSVTFRPAERSCGYHSLRVEPGDRSLHARSRTGFYGECS